MRNLYLISILSILSLTVLKANIIRVNNNAGISADFSSLQAAIDSATAGDTIYLEPSSTNYGNIIITKKLSIYGPGYFLAENGGQQANVNTCKINDLTMNANSSFSSISGLTITNTLYIYTGNIAITRCYFSSNSTCISFEGTNPNTNVLIAQNYISGSTIHGNGAQTYTVFFRNNYIGGTTLNHQDGGIVADFTNNVLNTYSHTVINSVFVNNIFINLNNFNLNQPQYNNGFENNIFRTSGTPVDTALGNVVGVNTTQLFLGNAVSTTDGQWQIIPGSIANGGGKEIPTGTPTDVGMYGGPNPYKLSGVPAIPTIYDLVVPTSNTTGGLNVTIKAKSQD